MPGSEEFIQTAVHALEAGGLAVWVRRGAVALGIIAIASIYLYQFRGLSTSQGMDQAQIGRAIARGEGWSTRQLQTHGRSVSEKIWTDTYNAPLPPFVDAVALLFVKPYWKITPRMLIYARDRAIAVMSIFLFLGSVVVLFFVARRLFDRRLALLACGLVFLCDAMLRDIVKGEYKDWASVIQRTQILEKFPLKWNTVALGLDSECICLQRP